MSFLKSKYFKRTKNIIKFQYLNEDNLYVVGQPELGYQLHLYVVKQDKTYEKLLATDDYSKIEEIIYQKSKKSKKNVDKIKKAC